MGNCLGSCFGTLRRKSHKNYFTGRYKEYNVGIEFDSLIEDDLAQQSENITVTDTERDHLLNKRYSDLVQDQKRRDAEIDAELRKQEENIRLEEEAYIAAKRESARAAHQARALEQQRSTSKPIANGTAKSSWLGDNESDWHVAGGEDDFEMFLESVKARSQTVRANASRLFSFRRSDGRTNKLAHIPVDPSASLEWDYQEAGMVPRPYGSTYTDHTNAYNRHLISSVSPKGNSGGSVSTQEASSEQMESDSDFEPEFVGADATQEQVLITKGWSSAPAQEAHSPGRTTPTLHNSTANSSSAKLNQSQVVAEMHSEKPSAPESTSIERSELSSPVVEPTAAAKTEKPPVSKSTTVIAASKGSHETDGGEATAAVSVNNPNTTTLTAKSEATTAPTSTKAVGVVEDDPFDFDKFLEELDFE